MKTQSRFAAVAACVALASAVLIADEPAASPPTAGSPTAGSPTTATAAPTPQENYNVASYGIGFEMGTQMKAAPIPISAEELKRGLEDALAGRERAIPAEQFEMAMMTIQREMMQKEVEAAMKAAEAEKARGKAYADDFAKQPGVVKTESGLLYQIITEGTGATPKPSDTVTVHYKGTLVDGTLFDTSKPEGETNPEPVKFRLDRVISGWTEGLQQIKVGGKARLVIPSDLAYGDMGGGGQIPGGATLVFDVELLDAVAAPTTQPE
jgi:FKBP-type peptidyl-prolyl cis-trans isomerase FkpA